MMVDGEKSILQTITFPYSPHWHIHSKTDMLLMQIYVMMHPTVSVRMPITVLTLPIHSVSPGELQKRTS